MKNVWQSDDLKCFDSKSECQMHEKRIKIRKELTRLLISRKLNEDWAESWADEIVEELFDTGVFDEYSM